ncbi:D-alanyl-D-alanine carboxypeptidase family protein [Paenibacillus xylaniclasticus]|uniref:D-alanyl-D-alanine carboxypeptidase family protein n=1 Tax=Paenibacillus xylaniclasticus TaxID=588083 RepID=UPI000FD73044|nr:MULTISPECIES: D-alanyl-D-alanine carboxypeptidase family protein [Paenibacillus]GFN33553.1 D-alanyl-D-alanine carboxypeptidase [Paenibacillus curdlanolyticus]
MKRIVLLAAAIGILLWIVRGEAWFVGHHTIKVEAKAAILIEANTGRTLFVQHADTPLPPASMSKMMTELLVLEAIRTGRMGWDDQVAVSRYAASVPGAGAGLLVGQSISVRQLFESMAIHSSNDAAVALAEYAAGTEKQFVRMMNDRAKQIGLSDDAVFANATGLSSADLAAFPEAASEGETSLTARDVATLARYLIRSFPEVLTITSRSAVYNNEGGSGALRTTNLMLPGERFAYPGSDGLKTGYTERAGYCFTGTTVRGNTRLIAVVMGTDTAEARFMETERLYELGFGDKQRGGSSLTAGLSRRLKVALGT